MTAPPDVVRIHCETPGCGRFLANAAFEYLDLPPCAGCGAVTIFRRVGGVIHTETVRAPKRVDRIGLTLHPPTDTT